MADKINTELLIGARDWNHEGWWGTFYPEDLPPEWRLTYYANEYRAVLAPPSVWREADPKQWQDDTPDTLRFVLETTTALLGKAVEMGMGMPGQVDAILLRGAEPPANFRSPIPLVVAPEAIPRRGGLIPVAWSPAMSLQATGPVPVALVGGEKIIPPADLRQILEKFIAAAKGHPRAFLFFQGDPPRVENLANAKTLAALLGY